ncbi:MAG: DapH/DapD/GlmU-related protein [Thermoplasmatota archaeon]
MVRDGFRGGKEKYDFSFISIWRSFQLIIIPITAYSLALLPIIILLAFIIPYITFSNPYHLIFLSFFLVILFFLFMICETIIPGLFIKLFRAYPKEGTYEISIKDKTFFKLCLNTMLYRPPLKLIEQFKLFPLRRLLHKLAGLQIGKTSILPGTELIYDPYSVEIGEETLFGGYVKITGHIVEKKLTIKKIKIGNNCLIGAETYILPGVIIEDNVTVGIRSLVTKDQILKKGKTYAGVPAKEIPSKQ